MTPTRKIYHGTHSACRSQIETHGVTTSRASKLVYVTDKLEVAKHFAAIWTFGLYAVGRLSSLTGLVVHATVPAELVHPVPEHPPDYLSVSGLIQPEWIECIQDVDLSEGYDDPKTRWKRLAELDSLLHWPIDCLERREDLLALVPLLEVQIEQAKIEAARNGTPITMQDLVTFGPA